MSFDGTSMSGFSYDICAYDGSRLSFRGPKVSLNESYVAFLGATETFGKFVERPFPDLLSDHLPRHVLNLGMVNGGVDAYLGDRKVIEMAQKADLRVLQVIGALNQTNHYFKVHPRRNDRFVGACEGLVRLFPEIDFAEFHFTKAMLVALHACSRKRYRMLCDELQKNWLARTTRLVKELGPNTVLLWFAQTKAPENSLVNPRDPMLVDASMLVKLREHACAYVEVIPEMSIMKEDHDALLKQMISPTVASQVMGKKAHEQAAQALQETCLHMLK